MAEFVAPLQLDTSRSDWKRQFRSIKTCECGARFGWVVYRDEFAQRDRWVPYNETDGQLHHRTCPKRERFRTLSKETKGAAVAPPPEPVKAPPPPKPAPQQWDLFGGQLETTKYPD